ncbi:SoxR reducing system RseC family protein [Azoarcus sp. L1K30]|uniref:SoxR reducing system RseC family protein n=1 Tax=Azoarcus sp. L1K30 TaxID=2820277 RepID=UPI001B829005|nr:SoxR reducing system RseC family protein [Azoarcus sp. L1K30]MBR0566552.1 SoxR reducing system RseC family protein [Azoarcus sp. L1K30]
MMQRSGKVLSIGDDGIVVRFERAAACGGCRAEKVCGTANTTDLVLDGSGCAARAGDDVTVELDGGLALRALLVTHLLPVMGLLAGMATASLIHLTDTGIAGVSFAGLGLGLIASRRAARHPSLQPTPRITPDPLNPPCASLHQESDR